MVSGMIQIQIWDTLFLKKHMLVTMDIGYQVQYGYEIKYDTSTST